MESSQYTYPDYVEELSKKGSILGLEPMQCLLDEIGHPEENLKIIHFAGTNGKGSTMAFLSSILMEAGKTVGRYLSPTIVCYEERFQINGSYISADKLERYYNIIRQTIENIRENGMPEPTLFEVETAIAFMYFADEAVDYVLLEVGMGGRLDATNVIRHPLLSVIVSISYDHMQFLGNTLEEITWQKAGIIKDSCPVIAAINPKEVQKVIKKAADEKKSACTLLDSGMTEILFSDYQSTSFCWKDHRFVIHLPGDHQVSNALTALAVAENLEGITLDHMTQGLEKCRWPGRLEVMADRPIFIRDGAHNADGALKLANYLQKHFTNRKIIYIMGVLRDKEYHKMLSYLLPLGESLYVFRPNNFRGLSARTLAEAALAQKELPVTICENVNEALTRARQEASLQDVMVLCGSLSFMEEMKWEL